MLLAGLVFLLGLGLSLTATAGGAAAYATVPTPVTVGTVIRSPGARLLTVGVASGPVGWGLTAATAGILAYQTKDSWWPLLKGTLTGGDGSTTAVGTATGSCSGALGFSRSSSGETLTATLTYAGCGGGKTVSFALYYSCASAGGYASGGPSTYSFVTASTGAPVVRTMTLCSGGSIGSATMVKTAGTVASPGAHAQWGIPDSAVSQTTTVQCRQPDGSMVSISDTYVGGGDRVYVPSCADRVPGSIPWSATIKAGVGAGGYERDVQTVTTNQDVFDEWADCFGPSGLQCVIRVWVDGQPCAVGVAVCEAWNKIAVDEPDRVQCKFGGHVVALSDCYPLRKSYAADTDPQTITETNPDGSPHYQHEPKVETSTETIPQTGTNPETVPSTTPETAPESQSCWGQGWSWNPVSWVYVPTKCALSWAFIPKSPPSFSDVPSPLPPGWLPSLPEMGASSCGPLVFPQLQLGFKDWTVGPVEYMDTCDDPWPLVRTLTYYGLLVGVLVSAIWMAYRAVASGLGMGVTIHGGGDNE